jgi:glycosyltransferase involved in cell wall biosynthesis
MLRISIVVPNFNSGDTIERAIHSLIEQEYPDKQLILVDGGSKDSSVSVIEKYRRHFDKIFIEKDQGQADALNKGFSLADGDIFGWLCADDELLPGAMKHVAECFACDPRAEVLTGKCERIYPDGTFFVSPARADAWEVINVQNVIEQPSTFWRSSLHRALGELDLSYRMAFDWDFWIRIESFPDIFLRSRTSPGMRAMNSPGKPSESSENTGPCMEAWPTSIDFCIIIST